MKPIIAGVVTIEWDGKPVDRMVVPEGSVIEKLRFHVGSRRRQHEVVIKFDPPVVPEVEA